MEGLLQFKDLEEHFANSLAIIDGQNQIVKEKQSLEAIVSKLIDEAKILKESEQNLTQQLKTFSSSAEDQDGISSLYVNLKEKYIELQDKYNQLGKEKVELEEKCQWEKNEITEDFVRQLKDFEERNEKQTNKFLKTQRELNNELAAQQASTGIRYDEMESRLQSQIKDMAKKLHDSVQSCNTIRQQLFTFKTCGSSDMDSAKKRIQELERELRLSKQQLQLTEEKLFNCARSKNVNVYSNNDNLHREMNRTGPTLPDSDRPSANIVKNRIIVYNETPQHSTTKPNYGFGTTKYNSLNVGTSIDQEASSSEEFSDVLRENINVPTEHLKNVQGAAGCPSRYNFKQSSHKYSIPPLKQVSVGQPKQRMLVKKRKLYNPNNLDYLADMEPPE